MSLPAKLAQFLSTAGRKILNPPDESPPFQTAHSVPIRLPVTDDTGFSVASTPISIGSTSSDKSSPAESTLREAISRLGGFGLDQDTPGDCVPIYIDEDCRSVNESSYQPARSTDDLMPPTSNASSRGSTSTVKRHPRPQGPTSPVSPPQSLLFESSPRRGDALPKSAIASPASSVRAQSVASVQGKTLRLSPVPGRPGPAQCSSSVQLQTPSKAPGVKHSNRILRPGTSAPASASLLATSSSATAVLCIPEEISAPDEVFNPLRAAPPSPTKSQSKVTNSLTVDALLGKIHNSRFKKDTLDLISLTGNAMTKVMIDGLASAASILRDYEIAWAAEDAAARARQSGIPVADREAYREELRFRLINKTFEAMQKQILCEPRMRPLCDTAIRIKIPRETKVFPASPAQLNNRGELRFNPDEQLIPGKLKPHFPYDIGHPVMVDPNPEFIDILSASFRLRFFGDLQKGGPLLQETMAREIMVHRKKKKMGEKAVVCMFRLAEEDYRWLQGSARCEWSKVAHFGWKCEECGCHHQVKVYH